jgi:hypothetical protein
LEKRELNATHGLQEGVKLARAAAESYASEHAKTAATDSATTSADNPTRKSNIFLAIQPTIHIEDAILSTGPDGEKVVSFAIHIHDPEHEISFSTLSQALPLQWLIWLDSPPPSNVHSGEWALPEEIQSILDAGGMDPREWVVEWVEEAVGLSVGVLAQKYVAKRMRVGETGEVGEILKNTAPDKVVGEEAKAMGM